MPEPKPFPCGNPGQPACPPQPCIAAVTAASNDVESHLALAQFALWVGAQPEAERNVWLGITKQA